MALERDDLDELNKPPRRMRSVQALPLLVAGAEDQAQNGQNNGHHGERTMAEPTVGELLLGEVRDMKRILSESTTEQAKMRVQVDGHEQDIRDLKLWRDNLPEKRRLQQQQDQTVWWQTTNGKINIALFLLVITTTIVPIISAHWH